MDIIANVLREAGVLIYVNLCVSVFVIAIIIDRIIALFFLYRIDVDAFVRVVINLLENNDFNKAAGLCKATKAPIARICRAGISKANEGSMEISTAIDEELMRATPLLEKRIASLWSLANLATLIGLLGTIFGLIRAFTALAAVSPEQKAAFLARGISEAMNNTAVGLAIAIICIIGHLILSGTGKKMVGDLEVGAVTFENYLTLRESPKSK